MSLGSFREGVLFVKKAQIEEIREKSKEELLDDLNSCRYSLLDSIGCRKLRLEMFFPGLASSLIVRYLVWKAKKNSKENWTSTVKGYLIKLFKKRAPYRINESDHIPPNTGGIVIGFNHPSLGEILRLIALVSKYYAYDNYLFPVNLPWYEALCPVVDKMEEAGFKLTPIITPSTRKKIAKLTDEETMKVVDSIAGSLNGVYIDLCKKFVKNGDVIVVAPSATRQKFVYKTDAMLEKTEKIEPGTMSLLATTLARGAEYANASFVPVTVIPPEDYGRGLNLGGMYRFGVSEPFSLKEAAALSKERYGDCRGRAFDYEFLGRIAVKMFDMEGFKKIAPFEDESAMQSLANLVENSKKAAR